MLDQNLYIKNILPYKLNAVHQLELALHRHLGWVEKGHRPKIEIKFDGKTSIVGNANAYINPVVESGVLNVRSLLEFMGITYDKKNNTLVNTTSRKPDDIGIEMFEINGKRLEKVYLERLKLDLKEKTDRAFEALRFVIYLANKFAAHITGEINKDKETLDKILWASQVTPIIVVNNFYITAELEVPDYKNEKIRPNERPDQS